MCPPFFSKLVSQVAYRSQPRRKPCLFSLQSLDQVLSPLDLAIVSTNEPLEPLPQFVLGSVSTHRVKIVLHFVDAIADQIQHGLDFGELRGEHPPSSITSFVPERGSRAVLTFYSPQ